MTNILNSIKLFNILLPKWHISVQRLRPFTNSSFHLHSHIGIYGEPVSRKFKIYRRLALCFDFTCKELQYILQSDWRG